MGSPVLGVKLHLSERTNERTDGRTVVFLSVVSVRGVHPMGERTAMLHRNLRGMG